MTIPTDNAVYALTAATSFPKGKWFLSRYMTALPIAAGDRDQFAELN